MSANVESIFYVSNEENNRFVPWHGLGTPVSEAPNSAEAIKLAGIDWTVEPKSIYTESGLQIPGYVANTRSSDNKVLGIVSNKYSIVQNADAFEFTDNLLGGEVKYETAGSLCNGKRVWLLARMPDYKVLDEDYEQYLCFTNTHDGTGAVKVASVPVRVVCQNTLNLALKEAKRTWSTRHMGDIKSKIHEAETTLELADKYMKEFAKNADILANTKVEAKDVFDVVRDVYGVDEDASDRQKKTAKEIEEGFYTCMFAPDILKYVGTAYQAVQAASDFATHATPHRLTKNYQENNFNRVLNGHVFIDKMFAKMMSIANKEAV